MRGEQEVRRFYDREAADYDARRWTHEAGIRTDHVQAEIVRELMAAAPAGPFLELGIGTGRFGVRLASRAHPCVGVDASGEMLRATADRARREGKTAHVRLLRGSGLALPVGSASLDSALCINVMSHIPAAEVAVRELARVLRPGGTLVISFPNAASPYLPYAALVRLTRRSLHRGVHTRWFTPNEIRSALTSAGFAIEEVRGQLVYSFARGTLLPRLLAPLDCAFRAGPLAWAGSSVFLRARRT